MFLDKIKNGIETFKKNIQTAGRWDRVQEQQNKSFVEKLK